MGISIWQLTIILLIVIVLFGSKRLKSLGEDLGSAIRGFRSTAKDEQSALEQEQKYSHDADR